jgi:hypothetical protein
MNRAPFETRIRMLSMLCEGSSMRSISRAADVSINTVAKLLVDAGKACATFHDEKVRGVKARRVQVDEIWSFTAAKLLITWLVGGRDSEYAKAFMDDLRSRLANRVQLTSDGHKAYLEAVEGAFGGDVDYAMLVKIFGAAPEAVKGRYSPADCIGARKERIEHNPDPKHISTSYAERQNLTMRMQMRRFTRLTNAFLKKFENQMHMVALYTVWYNFVKMHKTLRMTPAMAAGISDKLWSMTDLAELVDAALPKPGKRGPYKKEISN